jgi:hypothetical protein
VRRCRAIDRDCGNVTAGNAKRLSQETTAYPRSSRGVGKFYGLEAGMKLTLFPCVDCSDGNPGKPGSAQRRLNSASGIKHENVGAVSEGACVPKRTACCLVLMVPPNLKQPNEIVVIPIQQAQ